MFKASTIIFITLISAIIWAITYFVFFWGSGHPIRSFLLTAAGGLITYAIFREVGKPWEQHGHPFIPIVLSAIVAFAVSYFWGSFKAPQKAKAIIYCGDYEQWVEPDTIYVAKKADKGYVEWYSFGKHKNYNVYFDPKFQPFGVLSFNDTNSGKKKRLDVQQSGYGKYTFECVFPDGTTKRVDPMIHVPQ